MIEAFLLYCVLGSHFAVPPPTPQQMKLVEEMGNPNWLAREQATKDLDDLGDQSLGALELAVRNADPEIRHRAIGLLKKYYNVPVNKVSYIDGAYGLTVTLPSTGQEVTIPKGLPRYYYGLVKGNFEKEWSDDAAMEIMYEATVRFMRHMRRAGMTKEDVKAVIDAMESRSNAASGNWNQQFDFLDTEEKYLPLPWIPF